MSQSQLAAKLKLSPKTISAWATSRLIPGADMLAKLSQIFNIPKDDWYTDAPPSEPATKADIEALRSAIANLQATRGAESRELPGPYPSYLGERVFWREADNDPNAVTIPILSTVNAGLDPEQQPVEGWEELPRVTIPKEWLTDPHMFALRIQGASMTPTLQDGDIVLCCRNLEVPNNSIAVVFIPGEGMTVKRIFWSDGGTRLSLQPDNKEAPGMTINFADDPSNAVRVVALVTKLVDRRLV